MIQARPIRFLLTHGLAVCLCATSIAPMADANAGSGNLRNATTRKCCCGTPDGRCCGKGCCATPSPVGQPPMREPPLPRPDLLVLMTSPWHRSAANQPNLPASADSECTLLASAFPTLQQVSMRINT